MAWSVLLGIVGVIVLWFIIVYNGLVSLRNQVRSAWVRSTCS